MIILFNFYIKTFLGGKFVFKNYIDRTDFNSL